MGAGGGGGGDLPVNAESGGLVMDKITVENVTAGKDIAALPVLHSAVPIPDIPSDTNER